MSVTLIDTKRLRLVAFTPEQLRALISQADLYEERYGFRLAEGVRDFFAPDAVSPDWLARLATAASADPWRHGFALLHLSENLVIGTCGYKAPPDGAGMVEIGYGVAVGYQGRGFATEAAQALISYAFGTGLVRTVRAHTCSPANASTRVLEKCGLKCLGEVTDPEDGVIWRWERKETEVN